MTERCRIQDHVVDRYLQRVLRRPHETSNGIRSDERRRLKDTIRNEIRQSRRLEGYEENTLGSRNDTESYIFRNHVYFFRKGEDVCVSMMPINPGRAEKMESVLAEHGITPKLRNRDSVDTTRYVEKRVSKHNAYIEIPPKIVSFLQTVGWYHKRPVQELIRLFSWRQSRIKIGQLRVVLPEQSFPDDMRFYFHAGADLLIGATQTVGQPAVGGPRRNIDTVCFVLPLTKAQSFSLSLRNHRALWGSLDTKLQCDPTVLSHIYNKMGGRLVDALSFLMTQFRDASTAISDAEHEPAYVHEDLADGVVCYDAPDCFIYFDGMRIVDVVLKEEKGMMCEGVVPIAPEPEAPTQPILTLVVDPPDDAEDAEDVTDEPEASVFNAMRTLLTTSPKVTLKMNRQFGKLRRQEIRTILTQALGRMDTTVLRDTTRLSYERLIEELDLLDIPERPRDYGTFYACDAFVLHIHFTKIVDIFFIPSVAFDFDTYAHTDNTKIVSLNKVHPTQSVPAQISDTSAVIIDRCALRPAQLHSASVRSQMYNEEAAARKSKAERIRDNTECKFSSVAIQILYDQHPEIKNKASALKYMSRVIGEPVTLILFKRLIPTSFSSLRAVLPPDLHKRINSKLSYFTFNEFIVGVDSKKRCTISQIFMLAPRAAQARDSTCG